MDFSNHDYMSSVLFSEIKIVSVVDNSLDILPPMISVHPIDR